MLHIMSTLQSSIVLLKASASLLDHLDVRAAFEAMATGNYAPDAPPLSTAVAAATGLDRSDIIAAARITQVRS
jgi:hypothetical protein